MHIGNIDVFLESITIASASNKVLRKRFPHPDTIGPITTGGTHAITKQEGIDVAVAYGRDGRCEVNARL